jgi:hypothetical protein
MIFRDFSDFIFGYKDLNSLIYPRVTKEGYGKLEILFGTG